MTKSQRMQITLAEVEEALDSYPGDDWPPLVEENTFRSHAQRHPLLQPWLTTFDMSYLCRTIGTRMRSTEAHVHVVLMFSRWRAYTRIFPSLSICGRKEWASLDEFANALKTIEVLHALKR